MDLAPTWTIRKLSWRRRSICRVRVRVTRPNSDTIGRLNLAQLKLILTGITLCSHSKLFLSFWSLDHNFWTPAASSRNVIRNTTPPLSPSLPLHVRIRATYVCGRYLWWKRVSTSSLFVLVCLLIWRPQNAIMTDQSTMHLVRNSTF